MSTTLEGETLKSVLSTDLKINFAMVQVELAMEARCKEIFQAYLVEYSNFFNVKLNWWIDLQYAMYTQVRLTSICFMFFMRLILNMLWDAYN